MCEILSSKFICKPHFGTIICRHTHSFTLAFRCQMKQLTHDGPTRWLTQHIKSQMFRPNNFETKQLHVPCNLIKQPRNAFIIIGTVERYDCHPLRQSVIQAVSQPVSQPLNHWMKEFFFLSLTLLGNGPKHLSFVYVYFYTQIEWHIINISGRRYLLHIHWPVCVRIKVICVQLKVSISRHHVTTTIIKWYTLSPRFQTGFLVRRFHSDTEKKYIYIPA